MKYFNTNGCKGICIGLIQSVMSYPRFEEDKNVNNITVALH